MNKRYGQFTGSGIDPHWRVWPAEIVRKKKVNAEIKEQLILLLSLNQCLHLLAYNSYQAGVRSTMEQIMK